MKWVITAIFLSFANFSLVNAAEVIKANQDNIISLANAPLVTEVKSSVDEAGRPALHLAATFSSECTATEGGLLVRTVTHSDNSVTAVVLRGLNRAGCPDIYTPVEKRFTILLPTGFAGRKLLLIARHHKPGGFPALTLSGPPPQSKEPVQVETASPAGGPGAFYPQLQSIIVSPAKSGAGYHIDGVTNIKKDCFAYQTSITIYEVPDSEGVPSRDVVLIATDKHCQTKALLTSLNVEIATPQKNNGRSVVILNSADHKPLSVGP